MNLSLFLAKRFFSTGDRQQKNRASTPAIIVATSGIAVGLAVMIVSVCVVLGFKSEISYRLTGFGSHLEVFDTNALASPESYPVVTEGDIVQKLQQLPEIAHLQRFSEKQGILKTTNDFEAVVLKGLGEDSPKIQCDKVYKRNCHLSNAVRFVESARWRSGLCLFF